MVLSPIPVKKLLDVLGKNIDTQSVKQGGNLIDTYQKYFTTNPYVTHSVPNGRTHDDIRLEKLASSNRLNNQALQFQGQTSQELALASVQLMHEFHHNQFRFGPRIVHYTNHTENVAIEAVVAAKELSKSMTPEAIYTDAGEELDPEAVAFALGALHDALEDFFKNFRGTDLEITPELASQIAEMRIVEKFTPIIGENATKYFITLVKTLSITNDDDFPTSDYVEGIYHNFFTICVKRADYKHNLTSFPGFTPTYPLLIVPAQYQTIIENSEYVRTYAEGLILNLAVFNPDEIVPWDQKLKSEGIKTIEHIKNLFAKYNEPLAVYGIVNYFAELKLAIEQNLFDQFLAKSNLNAQDIIAKIDKLCERLM